MQFSPRNTYRSSPPTFLDRNAHATAAIENVTQGQPPTPNSDFLVLVPAELQKIARLALHDMLRVLDDTSDANAQSDVTMEVLRLVCRQNPKAKPKSVAMWGCGPDLGGSPGGYFSQMGLEYAEPSRIQEWIGSFPKSHHLKAQGRAELGRRVVSRLHSAPDDRAVATWGLAQLAFVASHADSLAALRRRAGSFFIFSTVLESFQKHVSRDAASPDDKVARDAVRVLAGTAAAAAEEIKSGMGRIVPERITSYELLRSQLGNMIPQHHTELDLLRAQLEQGEAGTSPQTHGKNERVFVETEKHEPFAANGVRAWAVSSLEIVLPQIVAASHDAQLLCDGLSLASSLAVASERAVISESEMQQKASRVILPALTATIPLMAAATQPDLCAVAEYLARVLMDATLSGRFTMPANKASATWAVKGMKSNPCSRPKYCITLAHGVGLK